MVESLERKPNWSEAIVTYARVDNCKFDGGLYVLIICSKLVEW